MVTFSDGEADKKYYRHFKINKGNRQNSDVDSMKEVITRRLKHFPDWGVPDLIIIDGGKAQISAVAPLLYGKVAFVGLAKRFETLVFWNNEDGTFKQFVLPEGNAKNVVVRVRDEAHRFARRLHHKLVTKTLLS
jgi:excinuclease ABC subunit C